MNHPFTDESMTDESVQIDHILIGTPSLERGIRELADLTGISPAPGGIHPKFGTHNALLALDRHRYLELIAPRPGATLSGGFEFLSDVRELAPVAWAAATSDIAKTRRRVQSAGFPTTAPTTGSRRAPDGSLLRWKMFRIEGVRIDEVPFFIEWGPKTEHPSTTSPAGCRLLSVTVTLPAPDAMQHLVRLLNVDLEVRKSSRRSMQIQIESPNGIVRLGYRS